MGNTQEAYAAFKKAYELYPTQPHAPEYTLAKKNMLEQEQLLARNASGEPAAISNPSSTPTITQTALITTDLTSEQALQWNQQYTEILKIILLSLPLYLPLYFHNTNYNKKSSLLANLLL